MRYLILLLSVFFLITCVSNLHARVIHVPGDWPTIQQAINNAVDSDTVLVADGTYYENVDFMGKSIVLMSENGPEETIIDGSNFGRVITLDSGEDSTSVIKGFTIQNGNSSAGDGGAIYCQSASPKIIRNILKSNSANKGGGIYCNSSSSPFIYNNCIIGNSASDWGGGIASLGSARIVNNTIKGNSAAGSGAKGGGLFCNSASEVVNNIVTDNYCSDEGGGIYCSGDPLITFNNFWNNTPNNYSPCSQGIGDISANPQYVDPSSGNYHLQFISPCIDAGTSTSVNVDIDEESRPYPNDGNWDMGADEYWPPGPEISVYPDYFVFTLFRDETDDTTMKIFNEGEVLLDFTIDWQASWLSLFPEGGSLSSGDSIAINITCDATGLEIFSYIDTIYINSNDPLEPTVEVPVVLNVQPNVTVGLTPYQTIVPRGGTLDFKQTFTNLTTQNQSFYQRFDVENSTGQNVWSSSISSFNVDSLAIFEKNYTLYVPFGSPVDTYTLYSTIGIAGPFIWDSDHFSFEIVPVTRPLSRRKHWDIIEH